MGGFTIKNLDLSALTGLQARLPSTANKVEHAVALKVSADTERYVPALNKVLVNSTKVKENMIIYPGPYAQYLYYGKVMVNSATGKGPAHYVDKMGNEVIRFPYGSHLKSTNRDLVFTKSVHPDATDHWFEVSKAQNLDKWLDTARKEIARELNK